MLACYRACCVLKGHLLELNFLYSESEVRRSTWIWELSRAAPMSFVQNVWILNQYSIDHKVVECDVYKFVTRNQSGSAVGGTKVVTTDRDGCIRAEFKVQFVK